MKNRKEIVLYAEAAGPVKNQKENRRHNTNTPPISLIHGLIGTLVKPDQVRHGLAPGGQT